VTRELVVISGKGGTGKTTMTASFAALGERMVMADCDVDAADLHLVLEPTVRERSDFSGGRQAIIRAGDCTGCGKCAEVCRFDAVSAVEAPGGGVYLIDEFACEGCGVCVEFCPARAIDFPEKINGECFLSDTRFGPMVHARLGVAEENSGKLVSLVRKKARDLAADLEYDMVLIDGSPGIGCPVIASVTGASLVLIVTEPTLSGLSDLERVAELAAHFRVPAALTVNKWNINAGIADRIERAAVDMGATAVGRVRYDGAATRAQIEKRSVVELGGAAADDIRAVWKNLAGLLDESGGRSTED
jgi:MinD superfamily P-loop ATPase